MVWYPYRAKTRPVEAVLLALCNVSLYQNHCKTGLKAGLTPFCSDWSWSTWVDYRWPSDRETTIAIDTILNQKVKIWSVIYVAIDKESTVRTQVETLRQYGAWLANRCDSLCFTTISMLFLAPYAGVAMAEEFIKFTQACFDRLRWSFQTAVAYRELSSEAAHEKRTKTRCA